MIEEKSLSFQIWSTSETAELNFPVRRVVCGGYSVRAFELQDPVRSHFIRHGYEVTLLR